MNSPDSGSRYTAQSHAAHDAEREADRMQPLNTASTACHRHRVQHPCAEEASGGAQQKKIERLYAAERRGAARCSPPAASASRRRSPPRRPRRETRRPRTRARTDSCSAAPVPLRPLAAGVVRSPGTDDRSASTISIDADRAGDDVEPLPRQAGGQQPREDRRTDDGADAEEPFKRVHDRRVLGGRCRDVADERQRTRLEDADRQSRTAPAARRRTGTSRRRRSRKQAAANSVRPAMIVAAPPEPIGELPQQQAGHAQSRSSSRTETFPPRSATAGTS